MSGHSKWSTIKRKKGALDAKRSKIFSKIIKEITVAVKEGGPDPEGNPRLRLAISNAKGANMPKDNVQRAITKASDKNASSFTEVTYEGYANYGVAVYVECLTDNLQRTVANVRSYFNKHNGKLETNGALSFQFDRKGVFTVPMSGLDEDEFMMEVIDAGAEEVETEDNFFTIYTAMEDFGSMMKKLEEMNIEAENAELQRIPKTTVKLEKEQAQKVMKLIEMFEDDDDVQNVFHNLELTDEMMEDM
ncbi:MAG: YebC/PmpR family DNA-binding transcriptional regulator [Bacteroides sp.]|jgi:YebC/PmpR family DNA-binding regulatory protein|nr:YebC/PmpR family DNA-binding transcriptional regulator [Bacteroides sp.]